MTKKNWVANFGRGGQPETGIMRGIEGKINSRKSVLFSPRLLKMDLTTIMPLRKEKQSESSTNTTTPKKHQNKILA